MRLSGGIKYLAHSDACGVGLGSPGAVYHRGVGALGAAELTG